MFAAGAGLMVGGASAAKSNDNTVMPDLLVTLVLEGGIVTIAAISIRREHCPGNWGLWSQLHPIDQGQPILADSAQDFFAAFLAAPDKMPHRLARSSRSIFQASLSKAQILVILGNCFNLFGNSNGQ